MNVDNFECVIALDGIPLEVTAELFEFEREPYSWGGSRGKEREVYILSVEIGGHNILDLLSDSVVEKLEERIKENV